MYVCMYVCMCMCIYIYISFSPTASDNLLSKQAVTRGLSTKMARTNPFSDRKNWWWFICSSGSLAP